MMGFGLPDDNLHAPNEKLSLANFYRGIEPSRDISKSWEAEKLEQALSPANSFHLWGRRFRQGFRLPPKARRKRNQTWIYDGGLLVRNPPFFMTPIRLATPDACASLGDRFRRQPGGSLL